MKIFLLILKSMRPKQWIKNFFIFMPVVFGGKVFDAQALAPAFAVFFLFCLASSGIYLMNDVKDSKKDSFHPLKKHRPISSGALNKNIALVLSIILILAASLSSIAAGANVFLVITAYIALNILYTMKLKHAVLFDIITIAVGFELRILAGSAVSHIHPSIWLQLCVFLLALFLGFIKRRQEKISLSQDAASHRNVLSNYKVYFLDQLIMISATLCIVFYGLYAVSGEVTARIGGKNMAYTIPFVIYGIFRYLYIVHIKNSGEDAAEILLSDMPLLITIAAWLAAAIFFVYGS